MVSIDRCEPAPRIRFILCRPDDPANIAAARKVIDRFGFPRLWVVSGPVGAGVLSVGDLETAISGCVFAAGFTRRGGQRRKSVQLSLEQFASGLPSILPEDQLKSDPFPRVAVVFGNEVSGLSDSELAMCHLAVTIPTDPGFPSLNLSHAVALAAYVIAREIDRETGSVSGKREPVSHERIGRGVGNISASLRSRGYLARGGPQGIETFLRDLLCRSACTEAEISRFERLFAELNDA